MKILVPGGGLEPPPPFRTRGRIYKPRAQMRDGMVGVLAFLGDQPRGGECGHLNAESNEQVAMRDKVGGVRFSIAADVRAGGVLRIRPPVVAFGIEIVQPSGAARRRRRGDGFGLLPEVPVGVRENAMALSTG